MNKLVALAAILGIALSVGSTAAFAGGETGADAAHTQAYWPQDDASDFYTGAPVQQAPVYHHRSRTQD
jgi:hypothetical protein